MLVLTRKAGQSVMVGDDIEVSVVSVIGASVQIDVGFRSPLGEQVRIGLQAPRVATAKASPGVTIGSEIAVSVLSVVGEKVRIGIQAPREVPVYRREVYVAIQREAAAGLAAAESVGSLSPRAPGGGYSSTR